MAEYFDTGWLRTLTPVTNQIASNGDDNAFADKDVVFDWLEIEVPRGISRLTSASMILQGNHGARAAEIDFQLWFAKSKDGIAPVTLGTPNAATAPYISIQTNLMGVIVFDDTHSTGDTTPYNNFYSTSIVRAGANSEQRDQGFTIDPEPSVTGGLSKIYVAGVSMGAINFSTGVLVNDSGGAPEAEKTSADASRTITVDGVDPRKVFDVGDTIQAMDLATIGKVTSLGSHSIVCDEIATALANNDEILTTSPVRIKLGLEY